MSDTILVAVDHLTDQKLAGINDRSQHDKSQHTHANTIEKIYSVSI